MKTTSSKVGRKRSKKNSHLPRHVYIDHGQVVYRPNRCEPPVRLCAADAPIEVILRALADHLATRASKHTLRWLCDKYLKSPKFKALAGETQDQYLKNYRQVIGTRFKSGKSFGDRDVASITKGLIRKYLDKRANDGAPIAGNREKAFLSAVFSWAIERDMVRDAKGQLITANPCHKVARNREVPRDRYVTDEEYAYVYQRARGYLRPLMELCYLLYGRISEPLDLTPADLTEAGIIVDRRKGSKDNLVRWSDRLRAAVRAAQAIPPQVPQKYVLHGRKGGRIPTSTVQTAWWRLMNQCAEEAKEAGVSFEKFTTHDLKAKGISDFIDRKGDTQNSAGHKSEEVRQRYNRTRDAVDPAG
ncbi:MAG: tyrosine-type recombinase/integrase [Thiogranum sp.]|nr:tyrosine-type recombinase/integrase [Thiogranum sp.]